MQKLSIADQFTLGQFESNPFPSDTATNDWNLEAASTATAYAAEVHSGALPVIGSSDEDGSAGPDAAAAGGKKGGGTTSGGGGTTTGGGTTGTNTGQWGTTTTVFHDVPIHWRILNPPTGDAGLPTDTYFSQQWNLTGAIGGINVSKAWQNYTGLGLKIGV